MSSRINKEWIKEDNFNTDEYRDGVLEFLTFMHKNLHGNKHSCPCRRCRNGTGQINVDDIFVHLMKHGMVKDYTLWRFHGETPIVNQVHQLPQPDIVEHVDESDFPKLDNLVNDACEIFSGDEGPSTSHIGDTSNQTSNDVTPGSTSQSGAASSYSVVGESASKKLKFNDYGLPIGPNASKSSSRLGHLARTHVPICYSSWPKVEAQYKDQLWKAYKDEYPDVKENHRNILMGKACDAWKKFKSKLRANLEGDDLTKWKENVPQNIKSEEWEKYCDHEATQYQKDQRKRNKAIKNNCERKSTHNTGRDGYARAAEKWEQKNGRPPTRAELWLDTHKRKDGTYAPHDQKFADKVKMLLKLFQASGEEETLDNGPIYETFGKDTRGRVRCIGSTVSRKAILASTFAQEMLKEVNKERDDWMEKVDNLREEMEGVKSVLEEFINDFKSGKFASVGHSVHITSAANATPTSVTHAPSTATPSLNDLTICEIQSYTGEIVGYGRKAQLGAVTSVHGHRLRPREVGVVLDNIKLLDFSVWGGKQGPCSTLKDVGKGGFMYWHDDFLPPLDDTLKNNEAILEN